MGGASLSRIQTWIKGQGRLVFLFSVQRQRMHVVAIRLLVEFRLASFHLSDCLASDGMVP